MSIIDELERLIKLFNTKDVEPLFLIFNYLKVFKHVIKRKKKDLLYLYSGSVFKFEKGSKIILIVTLQLQ